ncbi:uncharacterized protein [Anabrus simplex]|uniref:uncharacterized protein isoform X2 n=1 Tax=Anabrus simplex TaxID=316456 RepID=UPI0035A2AEA0
MLWSDVNPCSVIIMSGNVKSRVYCAVAQCRNYGFKSTGVMYHRFPRNDELKCLWISRCKRTNKFNTDNSRICSVHFLPTDYLRDLKNELLGLPTKKILRPDAVPSQFIPNWHGGFTTEGPGTTETASQVSEIMEEPPFIKCEPEWLSDVGEHLASDTAGNKVDIKIEPADEIDNLTGGEKNEDVVKDEPEFQETYLRVTSDNVCDIELKPDMKHFVLKEENTCTGSYENEEAKTIFAVTIRNDGCYLLYENVRLRGVPEDVR